MTIRLNSKTWWRHILLILATISLLLFFFFRTNIHADFEPSLFGLCINDDAVCESSFGSINLPKNEFSSQESFFSELASSSKSHSVDSNTRESEQSQQSYQPSPETSSFIEDTDFSTTNSVSIVKSESRSKYPYTIVTAISGNHLCALESFLHSLRNATKQLKPSQRPRIIVYSLGIIPKLIPVIDSLRKAEFMDEFIEFNWNKYPGFWHIQQPSSGQYAWKIGIINEVAKRWGGIIVWLDAGTRISLKAVKGFQGYVNVRGGLWSTVSFGEATDLTHKGMYDWFQDSPTRYLGKKNCNGAMFGLDAGNLTIVSNILDPLTRCAWDHDCIGPNGANRTNHRHDQSVLTYLMIKNGYRCVASPTAYGILSHNDRHCLKDLRNLRTEGKLLNPSFLDLKLKPGEIPEKTE